MLRNHINLKKTVEIIIVLLFLFNIIRTRAETTTIAVENEILKRASRPLRLPNTTFPLHYHIHISTNIHLEDLIYYTNATIDIEVRVSTNEIILHSKNLKNFQIKVDNIKTGETLDDLTYSIDTVSSFLIIHPIENYQAFEAGEQFRIEIIFTAKMYAKTVGLYWLTYSDVNNKTVYLAATQFEPTSARLAFPCYDEPAYKANFTIRITHGCDYMAISNMQAQQVHKHNHGNLQLTTTTFHTTPPISTYLVAFVVSNFEYISETYRETTHRIFTPPGSKDKGYEALHNAVHTVSTFESYFGINYPLAKLDHIALQKNYGAAMENWGLITYKEDSLIHRNDGDIHKLLKDVLTQNHEIAHQWFGNLVSPEWWTYAWMNEGFATYFGYVVTDLIYPEFKAMDFFITDIAERAYSINFITVRPMTYYVEKEAEILSIFDIISYQRAACVIKMFHHAFNGRTFIRGITKYLSKFQYAVANEINLFDGIQLAISEDPMLNNQKWSNSIRNIMLSWTHSEWIPIVSIIRNYDDNTITIKQRSKALYSKEHWWIPLNFATASKPDFSHTHVEYFMPPVANITISATDLGIDLKSSDWLIANIQQTGFYHVLYDNENLVRIAKTLQQDHTTIHPLNRAAIFQDLGPFIEGNDIQSVEVIFELLKYLHNEEDLIPWNQVADTIEFLDRNLYGTKSHSLYKEFVRDLIGPMFRRLFQSSLHVVTNTELLAKQKIIDMACLADLPECLNYTRKLAHDYIFLHKELQENTDYYSLHDSILCLGLKYLNDEEFNGIMDILSHSEHNSVYYDDLIYSLRCTQDPAHLLQFLNLLLGANSTHNIMNDSESMMYLFYIYKSNLVARPVMWRFFQRNYKLLCGSQFFAENFNRMAEYIPSKHRTLFFDLRRSVAAEMKIKEIDAENILIPIDSNRIGKKVIMSEIFLQKFGDDIHNWLLREKAPAAFAASTFGVRNAANRLSSVLRSMRKIFNNLYSINLKSNFKFPMQI